MLDTHKAGRLTKSSHLSISQTREICVGDEVEFTTISDPSASASNLRFSAIRIKHLPPGKVQFETLMEKSVEGSLDCRFRITSDSIHLPLICAIRTYLFW